LQDATETDGVDHIMKFNPLRPVAGLGVLMATVWLAGCAVPKVPQNVSWDTELTVPLASRVYRLSEITDADTVLQSETGGIGMLLPDSSLYFTCRRELDPISPGDQLKLDPIAYEIDHPLDVLHVALNVSRRQVTSLASLNPAMAQQHGLVADVPSFPFQVIVEIELGSTFVSACIDSGQVNVRLENTLPYAIEDTRIAWMADREQSSELYAGALTHAADTSYASPLAGQCLNQTMYVDVRGTASGGSQILIDSTQGVTLSLYVGEVLVNRYRGRIEQQEIVRDSVYTLTQQHEISEGVISSGHLTIQAVNQTTLADSVSLTISNVFSPAGVPLVLTEYFAANQSRTIGVDLHGYTFRSYHGLQQVHGRLRTLILASDGDVDYIANAQRVTADFRTDELRFRHFEGVLHDLAVDVERDSADVDQPPDGWETIHPAALDLLLTLRANVPVSAEMTVNLSSTRNGGVLGALTRSATAWLGRDTTLIFRDLTGLVPSLPDWIAYSGRATMNGPVSVDDTSSIRGSIVLTAPLRFTLENTHIPGDVQKAEPDAMEDVERVELTVRLWNALPLAGTLTLIAAADSQAVLANSGLPADTLCAVSLPAALITAGRVSGAGYREFTISPPEGLYDLLRHPPFYLRPDLTLNGSVGDTLTAYGSDYVRFSATAHVAYRLSSED
jgi:hypothetical protein